MYCIDSQTPLSVYVYVFLFSQLFYWGIICLVICYCHNKNEKNQQLEKKKKKLVIDVDDKITFEQLTSRNDSVYIVAVVFKANAQYSLLL